MDRRFLVLLLTASGAQAQPAPAGERLLNAWLDDQRAAVERVEGVRFTERAVRRVEGPTMHHDIRTETIVVRDRDGVHRRVVGARSHLGPLPHERLDRMERRLERSLGPGTEWTRGAALPLLLERLRARGPAREGTFRGEPVWEVPVVGRPDAGPRGGFDRGVLWFRRRPGPVQLAAARFERHLPSGGHATLHATFTRIGGLDLPMRHESEAVVRQRRRVRLFTVLVRGDVEYVGHEVWPRGDTR